jgi:hypothetical protein
MTIGLIGTIAISIPILFAIPPGPPKLLVRPDVPDSVFIDQTTDLSEVKAYLGRYSEANVTVFRQPPSPSYGGGSPESISVFYSTTGFAATGERWDTNEGYPIERYANLRVWFNTTELTVEDVWFVCSTEKSGTGQFVLRSDILEYLQTENGLCWDDPDPPIITCTLDNRQLGKC